MLSYPYSGSSTIFAGNFKEEVFSIGEKWEVLPVGSIIRAIFEIDTGTQESLFDIAYRLRACLFDATKSFPSDIPTVCNLYDQFTCILLEIDKLNIPDYLSYFLKTLPLQHNIVFSLQVEKYSNYFSDFQAYRHIRVAPLPVFEERESKKGDQGTPLPFLSDYPRYANWVSLLSLISSHHSPVNDSFKKITPREMVRLLDIYSESLLLSFNDLVVIKSLIESAILKKQNDHIDVDELIWNLPGLAHSLPSRVNEYEWRMIKASYDSKCKQSAFSSVTSLPGLVSLELILIKENDLFVKTCPCCQKPFVTNYFTAKYCHFPNVDLGGKLCCDEAPRLKYLAKKSLSSQRNKNRDTYKKWLDPIVNERRDYIQNLKRTILSSTIYAASPKERKAYFESIIQEVQTLFEKWNADSLAAIREFKNGKITKAECEARIAYPSERERGPLLYDILDGKKNLLIVSK